MCPGPNNNNKKSNKDTLQNPNTVRKKLYKTIRQSGHTKSGAVEKKLYKIRKEPMQNQKDFFNVCRKAKNGWYRTKI